jgi:hypothetical protein
MMMFEVPHLTNRHLSRARSIASGDRLFQSRFWLSG